MINDQGATWASAGDGPHPEPSVLIQWKGTEVCLDFYCHCGYKGHYDGGFAYGLRCGGCGAVWELPHAFGLVADGDPAAVQDT